MPHIEFEKANPHYAKSAVPHNAFHFVQRHFFLASGNRSG
jgi:hypothetical protein